MSESTTTPTTTKPGASMTTTPTIHTLKADIVAYGALRGEALALKNQRREAAGSELPQRPVAALAMAVEAAIIGRVIPDTLAAAQHFSEGYRRGHDTAQREYRRGVQVATEQGPPTYFGASQDDPGEDLQVHIGASGMYSAKAASVRVLTVQAAYDRLAQILEGEDLESFWLGYYATLRRTGHGAALRIAAADTLGG